MFRIISNFGTQASITRKNYAAYLPEKERKVTIREKQAAADAVAQAFRFERRFQRAKL